MKIVAVFRKFDFLLKNKYSIQKILSATTTMHLKQRPYNNAVGARNGGTEKDLLLQKLIHFL